MHIQDPLLTKYSSGRHTLTVIYEWCSIIIIPNYKQILILSRGNDDTVLFHYYFHFWIKWPLKIQRKSTWTLLEFLIVTDKVVYLILKIREVG